VAKLSATDIARVAKGAGFTGKNLTIAVAVALAESRGDPNNTGKVGEKGLWQIYPKAHPDWDRGGNLYDPAYNARAAFAISGGGSNWHPWTTYNLGTYLLWMNQAEVGAQNVEAKGGIGGAVAGALPDTSTLSATNPIAGITGPITAIGDAIKFLTVGENWARIAIIGMGGLLLVTALVVISRPVLEPVAKVASKGLA
jgi:hypothetical protein